jgi:aldose 1-epimerase
LTLAALDDDRLELADGRWRLVVAPSQGGSLLACERDGLAVLKPTAQPPAPGRPSVTCCHFPMIPFSNRIENGRFSFGGSSIRLAQNVAGSPHALHGQGWRAAWQVIERTRTSCALSFRHAAAPDGPWTYEGRQIISIEGDDLRIALAIENLSPDVMPVDSAFILSCRDRRTRASHSRRRVCVDGVAGAFPTMRVAVPASLDFRDGPRVSDRQGTDHCFDGWQRRATVSGDPLASLDLAASEERASSSSTSRRTPTILRRAVTHAVNAMNLPGVVESGLWSLAPREKRQISMTIRPMPEG